ncbi:hypothetical protein ACIRP3_17720, partial [Streptomyces sp. NPDC101209]|uniref:hypothetical protein n=1 Tax=Streptomyces sp. NPDC101209 TaxID=3366129 RepID=UPI0038173468
MAGSDGDDVNYFGSAGNGTVFNTHSQDNKASDIGSAPGGVGWWIGVGWVCSCIDKPTVLFFYWWGQTQ